ncbi:MAG: hypothetical protein ABGZ36_21615 [Actinomycetota bacterium]
MAGEASSVAVIFRRKRLPDELVEPRRAFDDQVERLEAARGALMSCLPVGRVDPAPVEIGLDLVADTLAELSAELDAWRCPPLEGAWQGCVDAIAESRGTIAEAHRVARESTELEELLGAVEDVDEPLGHAFGQAEQAFNAQRR